MTDIKGVLIGNPVEKSLSHLTHNYIFKMVGIAACYEKRNIDVGRLREEVAALRLGGYRWLAVTMPLKERMMDFVDEVDPEARAIGAINTIDVVGDGWIGHNTDGKGCFNAIERKRMVEGKRVVILGAGGSAKAIAYEGLRRGARVIVVNRTVERAQRMAEAMPIEVARAVPEDYDVLINATSVGMGERVMALDGDQILSGALVMDIVYSPLMTELLLNARAKGCEIVTGFEMFKELSYLQFELAFGEERVREMKKVTLEKLLTEN